MGIRRKEKNVLNRGRKRGNGTKAFFVQTKKEESFHLCGIAGGRTQRGCGKTIRRRTEARRYPTPGWVWEEMSVPVKEEVKESVVSQENGG